MIEKIEIKNIATYGAIAEQMTDLKKINFVYGSNGTGKTTISRVIDGHYSDRGCVVGWQNNTPLKTLVYNRDFVEKNFNQSDGIKGIFTLGEKDQDIIDKISVARSEFNQITTDTNQFQNTLGNELSPSGKYLELKELESSFVEKCWLAKSKHPNLKEAFTGLLGNKEKFKEKLISEFESNLSAVVPLQELENKARIIFGELKQNIPDIKILNSTNLLAHENNAILTKKVVGKTDVDIAALIQKLNNSDWVQRGREFYNSDERVCPFCQQGTPPSLENDLNEYFDDTFLNDTAKIRKLQTDYEVEAEQFKQSVQTLLDSSLSFLEVGKLQEKSNLFNTKIQINIQRIKEKNRDLSQSITLDPMGSLVSEINTLIEDANSKIETHNAMVSNHENEKKELIGQVWRYLLDNEIASDLTTYNTGMRNIISAIKNLKQQINVKQTGLETKQKEIQQLEKQTTSIQPTIDGVNSLLASCGFTGFSLAKAEQEQFYKIQRSDGSHVGETLSEGEQSFITFLYFYHLLKGSNTHSEITNNRVVVFDDPVSSMDSDILFIVSALIQNLFDEIRKPEGVIKQIFVLTHNVYFHKEVSFNSWRKGDECLKDASFWTVRKSNMMSKIEKHDTNPIKTPYELLWREVKNYSQDNPTIQNTMRRILEHYYKHLGNADPRRISDEFNGQDKVRCKSFFSWVHDGSHFSPDSLYYSNDDSAVSLYSDIFKQIFEKTGHISHYNMMMGIVTPEE